MARDRVGTLIGTYGCWCCSQEVPVREKAADAGGSISATCMWCSFANVAKRGTDHCKTLLSQVKRKEPRQAADPAAAAAPAAADTTKTAAPAAAEKVVPPRRTFAGPLFGGS